MHLPFWGDRGTLLHEWAPTQSPTKGLQRNLFVCGVDEIESGWVVQDNDPTSYAHASYMTGVLILGVQAVNYVEGARC